MKYAREDLSCILASFFFFSNVRSLFDKTDEVSIVLHQYRVDIGFFVETWLRKELPDESVAIEGYSLIRKDRQSLVLVEEA